MEYKCIMNKTRNVRSTQQKFATTFAVKPNSQLSLQMIYVLVVTKGDAESVLDSTSFKSYPVICRSVPNESGDYSLCYIKYKRKIYNTWESFKSDNNLPVGIMVAPLNGVYSFDPTGQVLLEQQEIRATNGGIGPGPRIRDVQQKYAEINRENPLPSVICVLITKQDDLFTSLDSTEFFEFHVDCKYHQVGNENYVLYVDEEGREYESWDCFLEKNSLEAGIMVTPLNGVYTFDANGRAELDVHLTSARETQINWKQKLVERSKKIDDERTIEDIQQEFATNSGIGSEVVWDLLSASQKHILIQKINQLIRDQSDDKLDKKSDEKSDEKSDKKSNKKSDKKKFEAIRGTILESVWAQRKYTNKNLLSAIIYIFVAKGDDIESAEKSSANFSCHPVFRTRRCINENGNSNLTSCMIFVDELGRVYQNWKSYLSDNELPEGVMIAPTNGIYTFDAKERVQLEKCITPNGGAARKTLKVADTTTAIGGIGAALVPLVALVAPVAAPVMLGAAVVGGATAVYSAVRSACNLVDRSKHEQSIGLNNAQARNSWLGVAAGAVGMGACGATKAMLTAAEAGKEISAATQLFVNGMNISSIVLSGTGVANGVIDIILKYEDSDEISSLDVVQLAASLVLFTHSVTNFKLASTLVNSAQQNTIGDYRKALSNRQRRMFDKMAKETMRTNGEQRGKINIIRNINEIPSKQYLNDLYKINKQLNEAKVRPSFGAAGEGVLLNNEVRVDTNILRNSVQHNIGPNVLGGVSNPIPSSHVESNSVSNRQATRVFYSRNYTQANNTPLQGETFRMAIQLSCGTLIALSEFCPKLCEIIGSQRSFKDIITTMADAFDERAFRFLMQLAEKFVDEFLDSINRVVKFYISAESIIYKMFTHCMDYIRKSYEDLLSKKEEIYKAIINHFSSLKTYNTEIGKNKCDICGDYFQICDLV